VLDARVSFELRPGDQGYVTGSVLFRDQSTLFFREYLDSSAGQVSKLMCSYHWQDADELLVFRYDNARHRPPLAMLDHKHTADGIVSSQEPTLGTVLAEVVTTAEWAQ
jgi:hypothetical protein